MTAAPRWVLVAAALGLVACGLREPREEAGDACPLPASALGSFVRVDGGGFLKGADGLDPEEGQPTQVFVSPFLLQAHEVTNDQFAAFVAATGYVTDAEKTGGSALFVEADTPQVELSWWRLGPEATWRTPGGAGTDLNGKGRHPVVHVSLRDARAYANWAGGRLPQEVEWEYAAQLGLPDPSRSESGVRTPDGVPLANTWDGLFPVKNTLLDGYARTAPVGCYPKTQLGTVDMIGNVWEWTETPFADGRVEFTMKGGSYLCGENYCRRYRPAARGHFEPDFSAGHLGFRIVKDLPR